MNPEQLVKRTWKQTVDELEIVIHNAELNVSMMKAQLKHARQMMGQTELPK